MRGFSFLTASFIFVPYLLASDAIPELQKEVSEIKKFKDRSESLREKEREVLSSVYKITRTQRRLAQKKSNLLEQRENLQADIGHLQKNILKVSEDIKLVKKQIVVRLRNLQRVNAPTLFQSIFGAQDIIEMDRSARILYKISKSDMDQLRAYQGLKNLLFQQQLDLKRKLSDFELNQNLLEQQEKNIKTTYLAKMEILKKLDSEDKKMLMNIKKMREKAKMQSDQYDQLDDLAVVFEENLYEQKGKLPMPTQGVVTQKFGIFNLMNDKLKIYNKGWFVSTIPGKEVKSIFKGKVIFSGDLPDQNQVVIIDHGEHFYSVYSNLSHVELQNGDDIEAEKVIGQTSNSRLFGHGLYVEIRHFSQPEDPAEWFKDNGMNLSSIKEQNI